jgi:hypothetical protein
MGGAPDGAPSSRERSEVREIINGRFDHADLV